ncbi:MULTISPECIES: hypothetical protein [unclassified Microbacterium]|uniref:hypothetical protein n=1 Tax=unclassified Microbacterium TaxID=2609290 RepID=UPI0016051018|nr:MULTISPECIES: hypothetical protein [unclassified Microbacterium]QNA93249.1 hypothetical protein G4G29_14685 [Microbacterium sp. Se63.02b]QYM63458.1 hypothetical protein K1X59_14735 [Microbacterium sp. Se5.02b]
MAISDDQKAQVLALHAQGLARNEIARRVGISAGSVTNICRAADRDFDRSETKRATEARQVDLAAGRIRLAKKMLAASEAMLDDIDGEYLVYNFGGKDNDYNEHLLAAAPVEVKRNIITTAGITFDKLTRIVEKSDTGLEQAVGVLDTLAEGFRTAADIYRGETPNEA